MNFLSGLLILITLQIAAVAVGLVVLEHFGLVETDLTSRLRAVVTWLGPQTKVSATEDANHALITIKLIRTRRRMFVNVLANANVVSAHVERADGSAQYWIEGGRGARDQQTVSAFGVY